MSRWVRNPVNRQTDRRTDRRGRHEKRQSNPNPQKGETRRKRAIYRAMLIGCSGRRDCEFIDKRNKSHPTYPKGWRDHYKASKRFKQPRE